MEMEGPPGNGGSSWKWRVRLDDKTVKSGDAPSRQAAVNRAIWLTDGALKPK
jgi:hypothetical protein